MEIPIFPAKLILLLLFLLPFQFLKSQQITPAKPFGDTKQVNDFITEEMQYPGNALKEGIQGTVLLKFLVDKDGTIKNLSVVKSVCPEIDAEAVRIFRMLLWEPASKLGYKIVSEQEFQVKFDVKKYHRVCKQRGYVTSTSPFQPVDTTNIIYTSAAIDKTPKPVFPDKDMTLNQFISKNIIYPEAAYRQDISGKVNLGFIVEPTGRVSNIIIVKPVGGGCSQEALRLLKLLHWMPGIKDEMAVRTQMNLEIIFSLPTDTQKQINQNSQNTSM
jgi:TonB family protein